MTEKQNIKIDGYVGKWSAIDKIELLTTFYLMENNYFGDETCYLVIDEKNHIICETYDDIMTALEDEDLI